MKHNNKEVKLEFNLPGFEKKDIQVNITRDNAEIKAEKTYEKKTENRGFSHHEKSYSSFYYHTNIPKVNPKKTKIDYNRGKLKITAQKENNN